VATEQSNVVNEKSSCLAGRCQRGRCKHSITHLLIHCSIAQEFWASCVGTDLHREGCKAFRLYYNVEKYINNITRYIL
jgi:reverse gyrase